MADFRTKHGLVVANSLIFASGNVGINNATPDAMLAVGGTANIKGNAVLTGTVSIGNSTVNAYGNSTCLWIGTENVSTGANVGANLTLSNTSIQIGNSTVNVQFNSSSIK